MTFRGWPADAFDFYRGLEVDNSKAYWQANKQRYEESVKAPFDALLGELDQEYGPFRMFRPYRDTRFRADTSPYKTAIAARLAGGGYVKMSADGLSAGCGLYRPAADQLERYRAAVADGRRGAALEKLVAEARAAKIEVAGAETLKTAPRGYPKDHPRIALLREKGLILWRDWPVGAWLGTKQAETRVVEFLRAAAPINRWLTRNVGESELEDARY